MYEYATLYKPVFGRPKFGSLINFVYKNEFYKTEFLNK